MDWWIYAVSYGMWQKGKVHAQSIEQARELAHILFDAPVDKTYLIKVSPLTRA